MQQRVKTIPYIHHFLVIFLFFLLNTGRSQTGINVQHLTTDQGLSSGIINCITQDNNGAVWIGTDNGLNKYDGNRVVVYKHNKEDSSSLAMNVIRVLLKDRKGRIWIGMWGALGLYDPVKNSFINYTRSNSTAKALKNLDITALAEDEQGHLWIGTRQGLCLYNEKADKFISYMATTDKGTVYYNRSNRITSIVPDMQGHLWLGTLAGIHRFTISDKTFITYDYSDNEINAGKLAEGYIFALCNDGDRLWVGYGERGYSILDKKTGLFRHFLKHEKAKLLGSQEINQLFKDSHGNIWMANALNGLYKYNSNGELLAHFINDPLNNASVSSNNFTCVFEDFNGMLWAGTEDMGVNLFFDRPDYFTIYKAAPGVPGKMPFDNITAIVQDKKGNWWLGGKTGLMMYDAMKNEFRNFKNIAGNDNSLIYDKVKCLALDSNNHLWIGTEKGLSKMNLNGFSFTNYSSDTSDNKLTGGSIIFSIMTLRNGTVVVSDNAGIDIYDKDKNVFRNKYSDTLLAKFIRTYYGPAWEEDNGDIWFSGNYGNLIITGKDLVIKKRLRKLGNIAGSIITGFKKDKLGRLWVSTTQGLAMKPPATDSFYTYTTADGLPSDNIASLETDAENNIWISTDNGLAKLIADANGRIETIKTFYSSDGLPADFFNEKASAKFQNGMFAFGTKKGLVLFNPAAAIEPASPPNATLSSFKVFNHEIRLPEKAKPIVLKYNENYFSFEMTTTDYNFPEKKQFAYRLIGFDDTLIYAGTRRYVGYSNIPPGKYTLQIVASNNGITWEKTGARIPITIVPALWQRVWFKGLLAALVLGLIAIIYFRRMKAIKYKAKLNKEMAQLRLTALRSQMNPHFIFNILNSVQNKILNSGNPQEAYNYLSEVSQLIRNTLNKSDKLLVTLQEETNGLIQYLKVESIRLGNTFEYNLTIDESIDTEEVLVPALMIQPFAENAIWHGLLQKQGSRKLNVEIKKQGENVLVTIRDNGIGREKASAFKENHKYPSMGVKASVERLKMLQELYHVQTDFTITDLKDEKGEAAGTKVNIVFPANLKEV